MASFTFFNLLALSIPALVFSQATISYPNNNPTVNNVDTVDVVYSSEWKAVNLTVYCETNSTNYAFYPVPVNPIGSSGIFALNDVQGTMVIPVYPVECHLELSDADNSSLYVNGGGFSMTSTAGTPVTWQLAALASTSATTSSTSVSSTTSSSSSSTTQSTSSPTTSSAVAAPTASATSSAASTLSTGAKAGIGVGVALGVLAILAIFAFFFWKRRQHNQRNQPMAQVSSAHGGPETFQAQPPGYHSATNLSPKHPQLNQRFVEPQEIGTNNYDNTTTYRHEMGS